MVPRHSLMDMFFSLFHSSISYLFEVYGCAGKCILNRLEKLQRRALKIIFNLPRCFPTSQLYERVRRFNIYPVKVNYYVATSVFSNKLVNKLTHCNILVVSQSSMRRMRHTTLYKLPRTRTEMGKKRFTYVVKLLGNHIEDAYSRHTSIAELKRRTRTFLCDDEARYTKLLGADKWY